VTLEILGPLEVVLDGRPVALRSRRLRVELAVLLANAGHVVSLDHLVRALWADDPPETAVGQVQTVVWRLRQLLGEACVGTRPGGYELVTGESEVDADRFAAVAVNAAELVRRGCLAEAADRYRDALGLWRGAPFADVQLPGDPHAGGFQAAVAALVEHRVAVERAHIDVQLALGQHVELVPVLRKRVAEEPLREELRERLMLALCRCGRRGEALEVYRQGRAVLVAELGLEPGAGLQRLNGRILADDASLDLVPADTPRPAQLPPGATDFVARTELADALAAVLVAGGGTASPFVAISGAAGSGKTALAVHLAHLVRTHFPGGQLFVDLHGVDDPRDPAEVLARFLRALGEDARTIPSDMDDRAALLRARTAGRRVLVVLDNAAGETQVRPLLPADPGCAVVLTSRRRLVALPNTREVDLGVFSPDEALDLLRVVLGPARVGAEREACLAVAEHCGYLPLAIRIAAARLAARPHWPVARLAEQLTDEARRLDVLRTGDLAVRSSLALSVDTVDGRERDLFTALGAVDAPVLPAWVGAPLLDLPVAVAEESLERLVEARLVEAVSTAYRMHDLVRAYARERLASAGPPQGDGAARLIGAWLTLADEAYARLPGGFRRVAELTAVRWSGWTAAEVDRLLADPAAWCEAHRAAIVAAVRQAATSGHALLAWNLAVTLARFFELREHLEDWRITHEVALQACLAAGDRRGEAYLLRGLGEMHLDQDRHSDALARLEPALSIMEDLADRAGQAAVLRAIGTAWRLLDRGERAMAALDEARAICAEIGDRVMEAQVLHNIGAVHRRAGRLAAAEEAYARALAAFEELDDRFGQGFTLCSLGLVAGRQPDRTGQADAFLRRSMAICREFGYRRGEAIALGNLGEMYQRLSRPEAAAKELIEAISISREIGDTHGEVIDLRRLGEVYLDLGRTSAARSVLSNGLTLARQLGSTGDQQALLELLGRAGGVRAS